MAKGITCRLRNKPRKTGGRSPNKVRSSVVAKGTNLRPKKQAPKTGGFALNKSRGSAAGEPPLRLFLEGGKAVVL